MGIFLESCVYSARFRGDMYRFSDFLASQKEKRQRKDMALRSV